MKTSAALPDDIAMNTLEDLYDYIFRVLAAIYRRESFKEEREPLLLSISSDRFVAFTHIDTSRISKNALLNLFMEVSLLPETSMTAVALEGWRLRAMKSDPDVMALAEEVEAGRVRVEDLTSHREEGLSIIMRSKEGARRLGWIALDRGECKLAKEALIDPSKEEGQLSGRLAEALKA